VKKPATLPKPSLETRLSFNRILSYFLGVKWLEQQACQKCYLFQS